MHPVRVASEVVVIVNLHILNHPSEGLSVVVVECAESSSFLWPEINHLSCGVSWISNDRGNEESNTQVSCLANVIADVIVHPKKEELVLQENVVEAESWPEQTLISYDWETTLEKIGRSFFERNSKEGLSW